MSCPPAVTSVVQKAGKPSIQSLLLEEIGAYLATQKERPYRAKQIAMSTEGVRNVRAEWRWNLLRQTPVAEIFYIGDAALDELITQRLRGLTALRADSTSLLEDQRGMVQQFYRHRRR